MPNDWERAYFGGETNALSSGQGDADRFDNLSEYISGSDPTNSASFFAVSANEDLAGFSVSWNAVSNREYSVWYCKTLARSLTNFVSGICYPQSSYTDTFHRADSGGFYRVEVQLVN